MKLQTRIVAQLVGTAFAVAFLFFAIGFLHSRYDMFDTKTSLLAVVLGLALLGFLLIAALTFHLARMIGHVLEQAIRFANELGNMENKEPGRLEPLPEDSPIPEVRRLSQALNRMSDRLRIAVAKLRRTHVRELEVRKTLETSNWIRRDFLSIAANEMMRSLNSMTVLEAYLEKIAGEGADVPPAQLSKFADIIRRKRTDLTTIVWLLNDLSRLDDRRSDLKLETFDQFEAFQLISNDMSALSKRRRCDVEYGYAFDLPRMITTDRDQFVRLFHLILQAVLEGSSPHSRILCSVAKKETGVDYVVSGPSDNRAPGEYMLYSSAQQEGGEKPRISHAVIALTVARCLAHSLGATFEVDCSEHDGFQIVVSFLSSDLTEPDVRPDSPASGVRLSQAQSLNVESMPRLPRAKIGSKLSVLLYSNDKGNSALLELLLKDFQCDVSSVGDEQEAIAKIREQRCDVLCLDLSGTFSGVAPEVNDLRAEWKKRRMCVIAITRSVTASEADRLTSMGIDIQLRSPIRISDLLDAIQRARRIIGKQDGGAKN